MKRFYTVILFAIYFCCSEVYSSIEDNKIDLSLLSDNESGNEYSNPKNSDEVEVPDEDNEANNSEMCKCVEKNTCKSTPTAPEDYNCPQNQEVCCFTSRRSDLELVNFVHFILCTKKSKCLNIYDNTDRDSPLPPCPELGHIICLDNLRLDLPEYENNIHQESPIHIIQEIIPFFKKNSVMDNYEANTIELINNKTLINNDESNNNNFKDSNIIIKNEAFDNSNFKYIPTNIPFLYYNYYHPISNRVYCCKNVPPYYFYNNGFPIQFLRV